MASFQSYAFPTKKAILLSEADRLGCQTKCEYGCQIVVSGLVGMDFVDFVVQ